METGYSDNPRIALTAAIPSYAPLSNLAAFPAAGFDVVSMANNHVMDSGPESMLKVVERLSEVGVRTVGAGINLAAAREPAIIERNGLKSADLPTTPISMGWFGTTTGRCFLVSELYASILAEPMFHDAASHAVPTEEGVHLIRHQQPVRGYESRICLLTVVDRLPKCLHRTDHFRSQF